VDYRIFTEPQQGAGYSRLVTLAKAAEDLGFDGFFVSDHYLVMGDSDPRWGPTDAFTTLAGLARDTTRLRLGTLVSPVTFRRPGQLAIIAAQIDDMSAGRLELGIGAGWFEDEHAARGIPFPPLGERFDRLEEQAEFLTGLWGTAPDQTYSFAGDHLDLTEAPALPQPTQSGGIPLIIGGGGTKRTPALAARYGAEFNFQFRPPDALAAQKEIVGSACAAQGRDPNSLIYSGGNAVCLGTTEAEFARRAANIGRDATELRENALAGSPAEIVDTLGQFAEAGADRIYFQVLDEDDVDHIALVASDVLSQL
jgi:F420-dependent oxidoreductase-like protein